MGVHADHFDNYTCNVTIREVSEEPAGEAETSLGGYTGAKTVRKEKGTRQLFCQPQYKSKQVVDICKGSDPSTRTIHGVTFLASLFKTS